MRSHSASDALIRRRLRLDHATLEAMSGRDPTEPSFVSVDDYLAVCGGDCLTVNFRDVRTGGDMIAATGMDIKTLADRSGKDQAWIRRLIDKPIGHMRLATVDHFVCSAGLVIGVRSPRGVDWPALADEMFPSRKKRTGHAV